MNGNIPTSTASMQGAKGKLNFFFRAALPLFILRESDLAFTYSKLNVTFIQTSGILHKSANLRCRYRPVLKNLSLVLWREGRNHDNFIYYENYEKKKIYTSFKNRSVVGQLNIDSGWQEITLSNPASSDEIQYVCEVFGTSGTESYSGKGTGVMDLVEPPRTKPKIIDANGKEYGANCSRKDTGSQIVIPKGDSVSLTCEAGFSKPAPKLSWQIPSGLTLTGNENSSFPGMGRVYRTVNITLRSVKARVQCHVLGPTPTGDSQDTILCLQIILRPGGKDSPSFPTVVVVVGSLAAIAMAIIIICSVLCYKKGKCPCVRMRREHNYLGREVTELGMHIFS